jgi:predicted ATPase
MELLSEMLSLAEKFIIERWMSLLFFSKIAVYLNSNGKPRYIVVDSLQKRNF